MGKNDSTRLQRKYLFAFLNLRENPYVIRAVILYAERGVLWITKSTIFVTLRRLLCNALIQPLFDYACSAWYPNLTQKLKHRIQTTQNECIRFCLQLDKLKHISHEELERLNWLPVTYRFKQCVNAIAYKAYVRYFFKT